MQTFLDLYGDRAISLVATCCNYDMHRLTYRYIDSWSYNILEIGSNEIRNVQVAKIPPNIFIAMLSAHDLYFYQSNKI